MITEKDAIKIGKALICGCDKEIDNNFNELGARYAINGALHKALDNLWHDVFSCTLRSKFDYNREIFIKACGIE